MTAKLPDDQWPVVSPVKRRLDIGVSVFGNPQKLRKTVESIRKNSVTDWRIIFVINPHPDSGIAAEVRAVVNGFAEWRAPLLEPPFTVFSVCGKYAVLQSPENIGYAGAVNALMARSSTDYVLYVDSDIEALTLGWDEQFSKLLDENPEVGQVFPGAGHYGFFSGAYHECLWNAGYCWMVRRRSPKLLPTGYSEFPNTDATRGPAEMMDTRLGHHEEVDLMIRMRMAGYRIACIPGVSVLHHASSTNSPESAKRIHAGVVSWMNKWNRYFCGDAFKFPNPDPDSGEGYDPRMLRYTDWPPCALYLERMTLAKFPDWNQSPRTVEVEGVGQ